jgi:diacylglycerol kinase family enzyme
VVVVSESSKWTALRDLPKLFRGTHIESPHVQVLRGSRVEVSSDRPFVIYADGDPIGQTPAAVTVAARALKVLVPRGS